MKALPTRVACLTPAGRAAIATILVRGPAAIQSVARHFESRNLVDLNDVPVDRIVYGTWRSSKESGEGVVLCKTSGDAIELHCHGGRAAVDAIISHLSDVGCESVLPSELVEDDLIHRECVEALAAARTPTVAAILMDQHRGSFHRSIQQIRQSVSQQDFPAARQQVQELTRFRKLGLHLAEPWKVVLVGAPNVGKSSLINALVGFERAIVFDQPGTTRDVVTAQTVINGWSIEFADTAGIRDTREPVEAAGIQRAVDQMSGSDLIVHVLDAVLLDAIDPKLDSLNDALIVVNKVDRCKSSRHELPRDALWTSALSGQGIEALLAEIGRRLGLESPPPGTATPFTQRQYDELDLAARAIDLGDGEQVRQALDRLVGLQSPA